MYGKDVIGSIVKKTTGLRDTPFVEAYALPNQEAVLVSENLITELVCRFGKQSLWI